MSIHPFPFVQVLLLPGSLDREHEVDGPKADNGEGEESRELLEIGSSNEMRHPTLPTG
jgi:hypothetical protein